MNPNIRAAQSAARALRARLAAEPRSVAQVLSLSEIDAIEEGLASASEEAPPWPTVAPLPELPDHELEHAVAAAVLNYRLTRERLEGFQASPTTQSRELARCQRAIEFAGERLALARKKMGAA